MRRSGIVTLVFLCILSLSNNLQAQTKSSGNETQAQTGVLTGQIVDGKGNPVAYATATLLKADSSVVNGDLTLENGNFSIKYTGPGRFLLRINIIGFKERYIGNITIAAGDASKKLGRITMSPESQMLSEVQITGEKALMEMSVDKKVFNVEKNITSTGGSASDMLKNVPSLAVGVDGEISLRGKDATILIDGKPATLLGGDVAAALQSLPASSVQSVEIITNPSAKYDAQGVSGIVNIVTKKDNKFGLNGIASIGAGTRDKYNGSLNLNLRNNKWNIFFNSSYRSNRNYQRTTTDRRLSDETLTSTSYEDNTRLFGGWFNTLGAEYTINDKSSITLTENLNRMMWGNDGTTFYYNNLDLGSDSSQTRGTNNLGSPLSSSTSLDYKYKFAKPRQELTANVTFVNTWVTRDQEFTTNFYNQHEQVKYRNAITQKAPGSGSNASLNAQADFTTPFFSKDGKLDAGWKSQLYWFESNNNAKVDSGNGAGFQSDLVLQNDYKYNQQVHAAYASFNDQKGRFAYQAGLRLEYSKYEGTSSLLSAGEKYANDFLSLFPSAYVSYKLKENQAIYLNYTRRINRPDFFRMMPYLDISNPMDTTAGNPNLIPEFIHNTELNYSKQFKQGHSIIASAYYQYTQNLVDRIRRVNSETGRSFTQPQNLDGGATYGFELIGKAQILPVWDATLNVNFFRNEIFADNLAYVLNTSGSSWFTKLNSNLKLPLGLSMQLSGTYEAPKVAAQGKTLEAWWLDVALRKNLWAGKANIVLNISDIFNTRKYTTIYNFTGSYQSVYKDRETRIGNITFTYRFGKSEVKSAGKRVKGQQNAPVPVKDRNNLKQGDDSDQGGF